MEMIMKTKKYDYYHVATPECAENFSCYIDAMKFYGKSAKPSTLYGVKNESDDYVCIMSK